jgi:hypothetical protein
MVRRTSPNVSLMTPLKSVFTLLYYCIKTNNLPAFLGGLQARHDRRLRKVLWRAMLRRAQGLAD